MKAKPIYDLLLTLNATNKYAMMDIGYYSMKYAQDIFNEIDESERKKSTEGIHYLKESAGYLRKAYDLFSDQERCDTSVLVFFNDVCFALRECGEDIEEYIKDIDTSNYYCD